MEEERGKEPPPLGKTLLLNLFLCDVSVAAGDHVDLYRPYSTGMSCSIMFFYFIS
jgi:hypothetical protein